MWSDSAAYAHAAAAVNASGHVGLSMMQFNPAETGIHPYHVVGIDDDFNDNAPPWELYVSYTSTGAWTW